MENAKKLAMVIDARHSLKSGEIPLYKIVAVLDTALWLMEQDLKERTPIKDICGCEESKSP